MLAKKQSDIFNEEKSREREGKLREGCKKEKRFRINRVSKGFTVFVIMNHMRATTNTSGQMVKRKTKEEQSE